MNFPSSICEYVHDRILITLVEIRIESLHQLLGRKDPGLGYKPKSDVCLQLKYERKNHYDYNSND